MKTENKNNDDDDVDKKIINNIKILALNDLNEDRKRSIRWS